jgi:hypothetical protein
VPPLAPQQEGLSLFAQIFVTHASQPLLSAGPVWQTLCAHVPVVPLLDEELLDDEALLDEEPLLDDEALVAPVLVELDPPEPEELDEPEPQAAVQLVCWHMSKALKSGLVSQAVVEVERHALHVASR